MANKVHPAGDANLGNTTIADGDSLIFQDGHQTISAGGNQSALTTGLSNVTFVQGSGVTFPASNPLRAAADHVKIEQGTNTKLWAHPDGNSPADAWTLFEQQSGESHFMTGGEVTTAEISGGFNEFQAEVAVDNYKITGATGEIRWNATAIDQVIVGAGATLYLDRSIDGTGQSRVEYGGTLICRQFEASTSQLATLTNGTLFIDGKCIWEQGTFTDATLGRNGFLDISKAKTAITATVRGDYRAIKNSKLESSIPGVSHTITEDPYYGNPDSDA